MSDKHWYSGQCPHGIALAFPCEQCITQVRERGKTKQEIWDERWMSMCDLIASWSKDRSRKTGAVIVDDRNTLLSLGWNGFPRGISDEVEERHKHPTKYAWSEHAERNAIYNAPCSVRGATMYLPWFPCSDCARAIIQSGIGKLVCIEPDWNAPKYGDDFRIANEMLTESPIKVRYVDIRKAPEYVHQK